MNASVNFNAGNRYPIFGTQVEPKNQRRRGQIIGEDEQIMKEDLNQATTPPTGAEPEPDAVYKFEFEAAPEPARQSNSKPTPVLPPLPPPTPRPVELGIGIGVSSSSCPCPCPAPPSSRSPKPAHKDNTPAQTASQRASRQPEA
ncbi:hypothetical protein GALMADRAFT_160469 [Galerina marginata CBS 339.88]|uniref:Uncharacterized protein n=1 Tax=Galerina marginata (strain CBS 339.88) TaxID=685588 RepID=A0A067SRV0_GALM3|nr:hypothetical protein GALMADRAFT_160469 [Galerina marginata CBS 339.88]